MPLPKRPLHGLADVNHVRRDRETLNQVLDHSFDDSRVMTAAEKLAGVTVINAAFEPGDVRRYGAKLDGINNDTAALIAATLATAGTGVPVVIPYGTMLVTPGTSQTGAATYNCACAMLSDTIYVGYNAATIKVSDNYSTDASPKELAIFSTSVAIAHVLFSGITFDLNGANNKMSPSRPASYNAFNHAAIMANGPNGYINNCTIQNCTFKNNAGVCFVVCALVAAGTTPPLGKTWVITNTLFLNGGTDSADHTSVYGWADNVVCDGNTFYQDNPPHTVGRTGGATGYEIHGANHRFVNNYVVNYTLGMYVAPNFTSPTLGSVVANNNFYCSDYGILIWRAASLSYAALDDILIDSNQFYFDNYTYSGQPAYKAAVAFQGQIATAQGAVNNIKIANNIAHNTGGTLLSFFVRWDTPTPTASQKCSNISITGNQVIGFTEGMHLITNSDNGQGLTEISRNQFIDLTPDGLGNPPIGIYVNATGNGVDMLVIDANTFIDSRGGSATFQYGIFLTTGTIANAYIGPQLYNGLTTANYTETGGIAITNWLGPARDGVSTITYSASMTPDWSAGTSHVITATNNTAFTVNLPTRGKDGSVLQLTIRNASGGALGAVTFNGNYGMSAWTQPANNFCRSIGFRKNGAIWTQIHQTGVDVVS